MGRFEVRSLRCSELRSPTFGSWPQLVPVAQVLSGLAQGYCLTFLGRCLVYLSFLSVYRCPARDGSGQGSVTDRLNQRG